MKKIYLFYALNFLAAFLLFQIQLIIAKIFLPKFGGSYLVWGACIVFFQFALLFGYLYAHISIKKFGVYRLSYAHFIVILLPLLLFPGRPLPEITAHGSLPLVIDIFFQLAITIGLAFFVLSTISIVTQSWLAHSELPQRHNPYMLYAISNIGSFTGLLSYPFFFEVFFDLDTQTIIWRILYLAFLSLYLSSLFTIDFTDKNFPSVKIFHKSFFARRYSYTDESVRQKAHWFLMSAAGCILFLSVTNIITYEIAPFPLLWIIPLCIYLASFALTFREKPLYPQWIKNKIHLVIAFSVLIFFFAQQRIITVSPQIIACFVFLFALCMFCQHELYVSRPKEKNQLTTFYLFVAFGGFSGSFLVTWMAPVFFILPLEFIFGLFVIGLALWIKEGRLNLNFYYIRLILYISFFIIAWPLVFEKYNVFALAMILFIFGFIFKELLKRTFSLCVCLLIVMALAPFVEDNWNKEGKTILSYRNYYGIYRVIYRPPALMLHHGTTMHGAQYVIADKEKNLEPLSYYHSDTPVGKLLNSNIFPTGRIGVIGLGVGTLCVYGKEGEEMDFFELDPDMPFIASPFHYLQNSKAKLNFYFQDARIALREIPLKRYDILIVDAFSGDSVPIHLLTTEAIQEYKPRLKDKGIILFHISNRYIDLAPVLFSNASAVNAFALIDWNEDLNRFSFATTWVALTWDREIYDMLIRGLHWKTNPDESSKKPLRPWTDKYSNIPLTFKADTLINSIKQSTPFYW